MDSWMKSLKSLFEELSVNIFSYIPVILNFALLVLLGFFLAKIVSKLVFKISNRIIRKFYKKFDQLDIEYPYENIPNFLKNISFWLILILFVFFAVDTLNLPAISNIFSVVAIYIPKLLSAFFIILFGFWFGLFTKALVSSNISEKTGVYQSEIVSEFAKWVIIFIACTIAIGQAGIQSTLLITILSIGIAAFLGAIALSFSLGAKSTIDNLISAFHTKKFLKAGDDVAIDNISGKVIDFTSTGALIKTNSGYAFIPAKKFANFVTEYNFKHKE